MAWQHLGGANNTGLPNNEIDPASHWLGTRNAAPLIIRTENATPAPVDGTEVMRLTPAANGRRVGIGTTSPQRRLHVEPTEIHSGGSGAGFSFGSRNDANVGGPSQFMETPASGERWVWYASFDGWQGVVTARLWSGTDLLTVNTDGNVNAQGSIITQGGIRAQYDIITQQGGIRAQGVEVNRDLVVEGKASIGVYTKSDPPGANTGALHVDQKPGHLRGAAIHSGGSAAGYSFASRAFEDYKWDCDEGTRWELWADSDHDGGSGAPDTHSVRLGNVQNGVRLFVTYAGQVVLPGGSVRSALGGPWGYMDVPFPEVPIGTLTRPVPDPPNTWVPAAGELVLGGIRTSIRGFDGPVDDPNRPPGRAGLRLGSHWIRTNGHEAELWMGFNRTLVLGGPLLGRTLQAAVPWIGPAYWSSSDARLKTNVRQVEGALEKLERIRGVAFEWAEAESPYALGDVPGKPSIGVIAQEVEEVFPEVVSTYEPGQESKEEEDYKAVDYNGLTSVLIEAVKELKAQNEALRSRIEALERAQE
jgi:hypothetical protein